MTDQILDNPGVAPVPSDVVTKQEPGQTHQSPWSAPPVNLNIYNDRKDTATSPPAAAPPPAKDDPPKQDSRLEELQSRLAEQQKMIEAAVRSELRARAMEAGLTDPDLVALPIFALPEGTVPGSDEIGKVIEAAKAAKPNLFADQTKTPGPGGMPPGAPGEPPREELPDEWNLYGTGIDMRIGFLPDGKEGYDTAPVFAEAMRRGINLREAKANAPKPTSIF